MNQAQTDIAQEEKNMFQSFKNFYDYYLLKDPITTAAQTDKNVNQGPTKTVSHAESMNKLLDNLIRDTNTANHTEESHNLASLKQCFSIPFTTMQENTSYFYDLYTKSNAALDKLEKEKQKYITTLTNTLNKENLTKAVRYMTKRPALVKKYINNPAQPLDETATKLEKTHIDQIAKNPIFAETEIIDQIKKDFKKAKEILQNKLDNATLQFNNMLSNNAELHELEEKITKVTTHKNDVFSKLFKTLVITRMVYGTGDIDKKLVVEVFTHTKQSIWT